jgi:hypothetical protein
MIVTDLVETGASQPNSTSQGAFPQQGGAMAQSGGTYTRPPMRSAQQGQPMQQGNDDFKKCTCKIKVDYDCVTVVFFFAMERYFMETSQAMS